MSRRQGWKVLQAGLMLLGFGLATFIWLTPVHLTAELAQEGMPAELQELVLGFRQVNTGEISDAVDRVTGKRGFMSHEMRPLFPAKIVGPAVTVSARPSTKTVPPSHALELIDTADPGSVLVIVMEGKDGKDITAMGGLMATAASIRGLEGAVLDGAVRDTREIQEVRFPVFSRGITPSTSVGRYETVGKQVPVVAGDVQVRPGDIIVGDVDGIVVVPLEHAAEVLKVAKQLEEREKAMAREIRRQRSILKALEQIGRI
ncbi:MAG: RraA family protein [candidate division NC10 bacterium]|nr:RraA family protein [candidate division NC10 bacterium]